MTLLQLLNGLARYDEPPTLEAVIDLHLALLVREDLEPCISVDLCKTRIGDDIALGLPLPFLWLCHLLQ